MKRFFQLLLTSIILLSGIISDVQAQKVKMKDKSSGDEQLWVAMHKLWEDHITWTRNVIFCLADDLPGADQAVTRLLKNQDDIGNAIKPYYGEQAGNQLTGLLH